MHARRVPVLIVIWVALALCGCGSSSEEQVARTGAPQRAPTFPKDVAPILFEHCVPCHRPGQGAPFTLLEYADVRQRADKIAKATQARRMPPWLPEPNEPGFIGERRLRAGQIEVIRRWADGGAIEGDPADLPKRPGGWQLGQPDLVVGLARPYVLQPGYADVFRNFVLPVTIRLESVRARGRVSSG